MGQEISKSQQITSLDPTDKIPVVRAPFGVAGSNKHIEFADLETQVASAQLFTQRITVTPAQLQDYDAIFIPFLPAPGAGKLIDIISSWTYLDYATSDHALAGTAGTHGLFTGVGAIELATANQITITFGADTYQKLEVINEIVNANEEVVFRSSSAKVTVAGDSPLIVEALYRIIDFN